jgi:hypothetical protein
MIKNMMDNPKKNRKNLTAYWGVSVPHEVFNNSQIRECLGAHPSLIPLEHVHSTLLYVGKKDGDTREELYLPLEDKMCTIHISHCGCSDDAMALKVEKILDQTGQLIPSHATQQHITMALKKGIKAVDSPKCFENQLIELSQSLVIEGKIKRYLF